MCDPINDPKDKCSETIIKRVRIHLLLKPMLPLNSFMLMVTRDRRIADGRIDEAWTTGDRRKEEVEKTSVDLFLLH
jgi:hypothetical protein